MGLFRKIHSRLLLWRNRLLPWRMGLRPRKVLASAAGYVGSNAKSAVVFHPLEVYQSHVGVRADLFQRLSPYFTYDTVDRLGPEPALMAQYAYSVVELPQGRLYTDNVGTIAVMAADGTLLGDVSYQFDADQPAPPQANEALRMRCWPKATPMKGTVLSLLAGGGSTNNYGHWLIDTLPRLEFVRRAGLAGQIDHYLVPSTRFDYQRDSLAMLGIAPEQILPAYPGLHLQPERLVVTAHPRGNRTYVLPDWLIGWNRQQFIAPSLAATAGKRFAKRAYITRRDTKIRNVRNEAEVIAYLRTQGFEPYTMAELPFAEKVALFAQAEAIVSVSGAGVNNLMFAQPGASFLEVFPPGLVHTQYYQFARCAGMHYDYLVCDPAKSPAREMQAGRAEDVTIDLAALAQKLESLLQTAANAPALAKV